MIIIMPLLLFLVFGIVEFAAAWRTFHVVTNSAREGARFAVIPSSTDAVVTAAVRTRLAAGGLEPDSATITLSCENAGVTTAGICAGLGATGKSDRVQIDYPYRFVLIGPIANVICGGCGVGSTSVTLSTMSVMRHE